MILVIVPENGQNVLTTPLHLILEQWQRDGIILTLLHLLARQTAHALPPARPLGPPRDLGHDPPNDLAIGHAVHLVHVLAHALYHLALRTRARVRDPVLQGGDEQARTDLEAEALIGGLNVTKSVKTSVGVMNTSFPTSVFAEIGRRIPPDNVPDDGAFQRPLPEAVATVVKARSVVSKLRSDLYIACPSRPVTRRLIFHQPRLSA